MDIQSMLGSAQASTGLDALYGTSKQQQQENGDASSQVYSWKSDNVTISAEALAKSGQSDQSENGKEEGGAAAGGGAGGSSSSGNEDKIKELQSKLQSLQSKLASVQASSDDPSAGAAIQAQIAAVQAEISALQAA